MQFRIERRGTEIVAVAGNKTLARWGRVVSCATRTPNNYYNAHRIAKGDIYESTESYSDHGQTERVLAAVQEQLPQAFRDAQWALRKLNDDDDFAVYNFLWGLIPGGLAWYGNTTKPARAAVKRAQKNLTFTLDAS